MISFFTLNECREIINLSNRLTLIGSREFGRFSYCTIDENWIVNRVVAVFEKDKNFKILQPPLVRLLRLEEGDSIPTHNFKYSEGQYKNTTYGSYIFLNSESTGGDIYIRSTLLNKRSGKGTIQNLDTKIKITEVTKNTSFILLVNYLSFNIQNLI